MTLNEGQGHRRTDDGHYLRSELDGHCLNSFSNNQTFITFMINICMTLNEGQGQCNNHMMHYHV